MVFDMLPTQNSAMRCPESPPATREDCADDVRLLLSLADEQNAFAIGEFGKVFLRQIILALISVEADQRETRLGGARPLQ